MEIPFQNIVVPDAFVGPRLQAAIDKAANIPGLGQPRAAVWIPASYAGDDTYVNPNNVPVFDMRGPGSISFANGALLPNTVLPFSATPVFNVAQSASYTMTLTGTVTSSSTTGTPKNGNLLSLTLIEDGTGTWTFAFPANFILPAGYTFDTAANHTNALTFKFDGTNWNLVSNAGGGSGASPANPNNILQKNQGGAFGASSISDNGTTVTVGNATTFSSTATVTGALAANSTATITGALTANSTAAISGALTTASTATIGGLFTTVVDSLFGGPNPYMDVRQFGVRGVVSVPATTGSINATSNALTLAAASTFQNGDGIVVRGAGTTLTLTTPAAPTVVASNARGGTGTGLTIANASGATTYQYQIVAVGIDGSFTPASSVTSIANGPATLGSQNVSISGWTQSQTTVTVTTSSAHNLVVGAMVLIAGAGNANGWWQVATAPDNTHFTFSTSDDTRLGAPASGGAAGTVTWFMCNHITWTPVTGAFRYLIYGRTSGSMVLLGVTLPQSSTFITAINNDPLANSWDDFGSTMTANISSSNVPDYYSLTPPVSGKNGDLVTTISSGAGTVNLVLAANAINTVAAATTKFDNAPTILAAALASTANKTGAVGVIFFPSTGTNATYVTNSVLDLRQTPRQLSVMQAGTITLNDTVILGTSIWSGQPVLPSNAPSFTRMAFPAVVSSTAVPMFYGPNTVLNMSYLTLVHNAYFGVIICNDQGQIPGGYIHNVNFQTSNSSDYMAMHFVLRADETGGTNYRFDQCAFIGGLSNVLGLTATPFVYMDGVGGPFDFNDTFLNRRGVFLRPSTLGGTTKVNLIYEQGGIMPMFSTFASGSVIGTGLEITNVVLDTMSAPLYTWYGTPSGVIKIPGAIPGLQQPLFNGPAGVAFQVSVTSGTNAGNSNSTFQTAQVTGTAIDGQLSNNSGSLYAENQFNTGVAIGNLFQLFANSQPQAAPSCAVSAGGSVLANTYTFTTAPVFPSGAAGGSAEGVMSPQSTSCTTSSGNQTVTITWATVPGAIGYNLYRCLAGSCASFQCASPWVVGGASTSYVWSSASPCGQSMSTMAGTGPAGVSANQVWSPQHVFTNGLQATVAPTTLTANRTQTLPDASGTFLLDSTATSAAGLAPVAFDNFNRANGGLGSNWTSNYSTNGTEAISGNTVIGGSASANTNSYWTAWGFLNDQACEVSIAATTANQQGCSLRNTGTTTATTNGYICDVGTAAITIRKVTNGGIANVSNTAMTSAVGDRVKFTAIGTTLTCTNTTASGTVTSTSGTDPTFSSGAPGIFNARNNGGLVNWTGYSLPKNAAFAADSISTDQEFFNNQLINGALVVGAFPSTTTGTALTSGTTYTRALVIGNVGAQSNSLNSASGNSGRVAQSSGTLTSGNLASFDANGNVVNSTQSATGVAHTVATGTASLGTSAISSGTCATVVTVAATGVATTDVITATFNSDPSVITGYGPSASGSLFIQSYPTSNNVNFNVCNNTAGSITPGAATLNWRVAR